MRTKYTQEKLKAEFPVGTKVKVRTMTKGVVATYYGVEGEVIENDKEVFGQPIIRVEFFEPVKRSGGWSDITSLGLYGENIEKI
jgi:hypothetical protein